MSGASSDNKGQRMTTSGTTIDNDNHSHCSHPSLEVVVYLFVSLNWWQSSILRSVLCCFHSLYHYSHSLSLIAIRCHSLLSLVVTLCHSLYHTLSFVVTRCTTRYHPLSFVATRCHSLLLVVIQCTTCLSFYKRSKVSSRGFHWSNSFNFSLHRINTVRILWRKKTKSNQRNIHFHLSQLLTLQKLFFYCGVKNHCQQLFVCHEHVFYTKIYLEWDFVLHWKRFCFH